MREKGAFVDEGQVLWMGRGLETGVESSLRRLGQGSPLRLSAHPVLWSASI